MTKKSVTSQKSNTSYNSKTSKSVNTVKVEIKKEVPQQKQNKFLLGDVSQIKNQIDELYAKAA